MCCLTHTAITDMLLALFVCLSFVLPFLFHNLRKDNSLSVFAYPIIISPLKILFQPSQCTVGQYTITFT